MKKFKTIKTIKSFEGSKLTKAQMYQAAGGMRQNPCDQTGKTFSVCHIDGVTDCDCR